MKNKAYHLNNFTFNQSDVVMLDTNIWLYLFPAPSNSQNYFIKQYSAAFKHLQTAKVTIVINAIILSEYLNRYCRIEWEALHKANYPNFKNFRQSNNYCSVGQRAVADAKTILKFCCKKNDDFSNSDVILLLNDFESGNVDFNDGLITESCRLNGWKLITNDSDFTEGGIEVLTANPKLIANCI